MTIMTASAASMATLRDVYTVCQNKPNAFAKGLDVMSRLRRDSTLDEFAAQLTPIVQILLSNTDGGEYAERLLDLTAQFLSATPDASLFARMLDSAAGWSASDSKVVRERCCRLVEKTLCHLKDDSAVDDDLFDRVEAAMMTRLGDRIGAVRAAAAGALARLQDPADAGCKIVNAFLFHLERDPCVEVRSTILGRLAPSTRTLAAIVARTRDVRDAVRRLAYERLADKVPVRYLSLKQRTSVLAEGLADPASAVRQAVTQKLVPAWLRQAKGGPVDFLRLLDVHGSPEAVGDFVDWYLKEHDPKESAADFAAAWLDADKLVPDDKLSGETSLYWRHLVTHLRAVGSADAEALAESVFPDTVVYCGYLVRQVCSFDDGWDTLRQLDHRFVARQLLALALAADVADSAGRARLVETAHALLASPKTGSVLVRPLVKLLARLFPGANQLGQEVALAMSSLSAPPASSQEVRERAELQLPPAGIDVVKMRVKLNMFREELSICVAREDFAGAQEAKQKVLEVERTLQDAQAAAEAALEEETTPEEGQQEQDGATTLKIATLVTELLAVGPFTSLSPFLQSCLDDIVLPGIVSTDTAVRKQATHALAMCCALSRRAAVKHAQLLFQIALADTPPIRAIALAGAVDLVLAFGVEPFESVLRNIFEGEDSEDSDGSDEEGEALPRDAPALLVNCLLCYVDDEDETLRAVAVEGMAKLQLFGRVCSPALLSALVLRWMHPDADPDSPSHRVLRHFVVAYSRVGPQSLRCFERAFLPTLSTVLDAPASSSLSRLSPSDLLNFLVDVTLPRSPDEPGKRVPTAAAAAEQTCHDRLAVELCSQVLKDPRSEDALVFLKALTMLEISERASFDDLASAARKMRSRVKAKRGVALVKKFDDKLKALAESCSPAAAAAQDAGTPSSASVVIDSSTLSDRSCSVFGRSESTSLNGEDGGPPCSASTTSSARRLLDSQDLFPLSDDP